MAGSYGAAIAAVFVAAALTASAPATVAVTVGHSTLSIPCGTGVQAPADWYFPAGSPTGTVWLQHAYLASKTDMAAAAAMLAASTGAVVVAPTLSSSPSEQGGCWLLGASLQQAAARMFVDRAALTASAHAAGWAGPLPSQFVLSGHSGGGTFAVATGGYLAATSAFADLRAVVMFDGGTTDPVAQQERDALAALAGPNWRPVLQIATPVVAACNGYSYGTQALTDMRPGQFVGVRVSGGTHLDVAGYESFNVWGYVLCGWPVAGNVSAVRQIAADWIRNALTGSTGGITGGTPGQRIAVGSATVTVLPGG